jgi:hypothetical protein
MVLIDGIKKHGKNSGQLLKLRKVQIRLDFAYLQQKDTIEK